MQGGTRFVLKYSPRLMCSTGPRPSVAHHLMSGEEPDPWKHAYLNCSRKPGCRKLLLQVKTRHKAIPLLTRQGFSSSNRNTPNQLFQIILAVESQLTPPHPSSSAHHAVSYNTVCLHTAAYTISRKIPCVVKPKRPVYKLPLHRSSSRFEIQVS